MLIMINTFLQMIIMTNVIFILLNVDMFRFLDRPALTPAEAVEICTSLGRRRNVVIEGTFMGVIERKDKALIHYSKNTLNNTVVLLTNTNAKAILNQYNRIAYSATTRVQGTIDYIDNEFIIYNINKIADMHGNYITKYYSNRYGIAAILSIILEVIRFVCLRFIW